jgi:hypothetical protein
MLPPDSRRQRLQQSVDWAAEPELELELELEVELERELLEEDEVVCCSGLAAGLLAARVGKDPERCPASNSGEAWFRASRWRNVSN